jgi:hypothetical protein
MPIADDSARDYNRHSERERMQATVTDVAVRAWTARIL